MLVDGPDLELLVVPTELHLLAPDRRRVGRSPPLRGSPASRSGRPAARDGAAVTRLDGR